MNLNRTAWNILFAATLAALTAATLRAADDATNAAPEVTVTPIVNYVHVKGNAEQFRQDTWMKDGVTGGIGEFTLDQKLGKDATLHLDGHGIFDANDYKLQLEIAKPDFGYIRAGYTEFQKYSAWPKFSGFTRPGLGMSDGNIFFEAGLTLPNLPKIVLGYERQYRNGTQSLLEWGPTATPFGSVPVAAGVKNVFPSYTDIDETVDIVKLGISHTLGKIDLADDFRYEWYRNSTFTYDQGLTTVPQNVSVSEETHYGLLQNVFHMESHFNDKFYWSVGYLFDRMSGDGGLNLNTVPFVGNTSKDWFTRANDFDQDSHVVNVNAFYGPWKQISIYGGLQAEKTHTSGDANAELLEITGGLPVSPTALMMSELEKESLDETIGARYTGLPFTTIYADAKWTEEQYHESEFESVAATPADYLTRDTDVFRQQYTVGFNNSPCRRVTISGHYRHIEKDNSYENQPGPGAPDGYPGFLTAEDYVSDEAVGKIALRATSQLNFAFQYKLASTDIQEANQSAIGGIVPAGTLEAGDYNSSTYTLSTTYLPLPRLYLTGSVSLQDTVTKSYANNVPTVLPYRSNVYTVFGALGWAIDDKTDANLDYTYSQCDDFKNNYTVGLPLGLDNHRHGLSASLARRLTKNLIARIRYGYYEYDEAHTAGVNNYRANLASASCTLRF